MALFRIIFSLILSFPIFSLAQENAPLDMSLKPKEVRGEEKILDVYKDMIVIQNRAKEKADRWLFNPFFNFDFSDGPTTMYAFTLNVGYSLGEEWEAYLSYSPMIIANERMMFQQVNNRELSDGSILKINYAKPKSFAGVEILWAPLYGKDAWGPRKIIRSDMFVKTGLGMVQFEGESGMRTFLMLGKTFFVTNYFNIRLAAGAGIVQTPIDGVKKNQTVGLLDFGNVWYF